MNHWLILPILLPLFAGCLLLLLVGERLQRGLSLLATLTLLPLAAVLLIQHGRQRRGERLCPGQLGRAVRHRAGARPPRCPDDCSPPRCSPALR